MKSLTEIYCAIFFSHHLKIYFEKFHQKVDYLIDSPQIFQSNVLTTLKPGPKESIYVDTWYEKKIFWLCEKDNKQNKFAETIIECHLKN